MVFFADQVKTFNAIAGRPYIFVTGSHAVIDLEPVFYAERDTGLFGEKGVRSNAHA